MSDDTQQPLSPSGSLQHRLADVTERIRKAAEFSGRSAEDVILLAVAKKVPADVINDALVLGVRNVGENRVQEASAKRAHLQNADDVQHHLIGTLQTNKAKKAIELFDVIQSVDRPKLAETLNRLAGEHGKVQRCLIEIKFSPEPSKSGVPLADARD